MLINALSRAGPVAKIWTISSSESESSQETGTSIPGPSV